LWVKLRRTHCEQMSSGLSLKADIAQYSRHVSKVPRTDSCAASKDGLIDHLVGKINSCCEIVSLKTCAVLQLMTSLNRVRRLCRCAGGTFPKRQHANLPVCWLAPGPPVRRTNQNRLISPYIVPNPRFSATWKTPWHNAGLVNFANFQIAIFRRELDR
jgi:hypothetical protein